MMRRTQYSLFELKKQYEHGGDIGVGKRKVSRPFDRNKALHMVLRSDEAKGRYSFLRPRNRTIVQALLLSFAKKWQVRIYDASINSNHVHLLARALDKRTLKGFLRALPGAIAMAITGARKGAKLLKRFWTARIYSRIVEWGTAFRRVKSYILRNTLESLGIIPYTRRKARYPKRD